MDLIASFAALCRYLYRIKVNLIVLCVFYLAYFHWCCKGWYLPSPNIGVVFFPYFRFGLRGKGLESRANTYSWAHASNPWPDSSQMDLLKPGSGDIQFPDDPSNFTYVAPTKYPANDSWSPDMLAFIQYNLEQNPDLTGKDLKMFRYAVDSIDEIALHSTKSIRRLCHKFERAGLRDRISADLWSHGFFRMDSQFELPNNHNSTRVLCKMMWDIKELTLMSKYHLYMPNQMFRDLLREIKQIMEYLDNAQELPKYYDSPDWNLNGRLGQDLLRFDQFIMSEVPFGKGEVSISPQGPWWWPWANHRRAFPDGRLIKYRTTRNNYTDGEPMLHETAEQFYGFIRANTYIDRFQIAEDEDVNDQNRFNYGPLPIPLGDRYASSTVKWAWEAKFCPWGYTGRELPANTYADLRKWENLALQSWASGESQECEALDINIGIAKITPMDYNGYAIGEMNACQTEGLFGASGPGYYMDLLRNHFPFHDDCYRRTNMVALPHLFGVVRNAAWHYHMRWNWHTGPRQAVLEFWLALVIIPGLFCGNHRGKVEHRLNKIHD